MADLKPVVGVVGASARAAVHSLARAGYFAWAVDLFADCDLARTTPSARCAFADFPHALPALTDPFPPGPVVYTGGLENHPDVVAALAARRPLWGNTPSALNVVRQPTFPARVWPYDDEAVRCPTVLPGEAAPPPGAWLVKTRRGAGGEGIRPYHPADPPLAPAACYLQEFVPGEPMSALFVGGGGDAKLLGVTEQLVGESWLHAGRFRYAGTVGPVELPPQAERALGEFGRAAARGAGLVGLFGVDFVLAAGVAYPVEINPRYPASAEVIEFATGRAVMLDHAVGCTDPVGVRRLRRPGHHRVVGKAVYYAPAALTFPTAGPWDDWEKPFDAWNLPRFADVPEPGAHFEPGWPVLTAFATGSSPVEVRSRLQSRAAELDQLLAPGAEGHAP
jgi:predicted ATP-grasp superfamily ATP-dependent carboligase